MARKIQTDTEVLALITDKADEGSNDSNDVEFFDRPFVRSRLIGKDDEDDSDDDDNEADIVLVSAEQRYCPAPMLPVGAPLMIESSPDSADSARPKSSNDSCASTSETSFSTPSRGRAGRPRRIVTPSSSSSNSSRTTSPIKTRRYQAIEPAVFEEPIVPQHTSKKEIRNIKWVHILRHEETVEPTGFLDINNTRDSVKEPLDYYSEYFSDDFYEELAAFTNLYATQCNVAFEKTDKSEIRKFMAIHIFMGALRLPQVRDYWEKGSRQEFVSDAMTRKRFFQLRAHVHFCRESSADKRDKFYKVCTFKK